MDNQEDLKFRGKQKFNPSKDIKRADKNIF